MRIISPQNQLEVIMLLPPTPHSRANSVLTTSAHSLSFLDHVGRWRQLRGVDYRISGILC